MVLIIGFGGVDGFGAGGVAPGNEVGFEFGKVFGTTGCGDGTPCTDGATGAVLAGLVGGTTAGWLGAIGGVGEGVGCGGTGPVGCGFGV